jgi:hypothetical protein
VELVASDTEVRAENEGPWLPLQDDGQEATDAPLKGDPLLLREAARAAAIAGTRTPPMTASMCRMDQKDDLGTIW